MVGQWACEVELVILVARGFRMVKQIHPCTYLYRKITSGIVLRVDNLRNTPNGLHGFGAAAQILYNPLI